MIGGDVADDADLEPSHAPSRADWKTKYAEARRSRDEARREAVKARRAISLARHDVLEPSTLQGLLPHRFRALRARVRAQNPEARERSFKATCSAYAEAGEELPIECRNVDGLRWHMPVPTSRAEELATWFEKQHRFPYAAIVQSRDVSIGGVMLDIGANVGGTAIPRVILGDAAAAYCAEAEPLNYHCLRLNVLENGLAGLVLPDRVAITDRDGVVRLRRGKKHTGHHLVDGADAPGDVLEVPACTLDTWVRRHEIDLDAVTFIKVDVEGHEQQVLDGAAEVLARPHIAWQLEVWAPQLSAAGSSAARVAATLARHFTHYVDLRRDIPAPRVRPMAELDQMASGLDSAGGKTDIVVFNLA